MIKTITEKILNSAPSLSVGIIGDFCLDAYLVIDRSRSEVSVETGLSTLPVKEQRYAPGGAGNVAVNLLSLGTGNVTLFGVLGDDVYGCKLKSLLEEAGADTGALLIQKEEWDTQVYTKLIDEGKERERIDFGNFNMATEKTAESLLERIGSSIAGFDVVIINQQIKNGLHTDFFKAGVKRLFKSNGGTGPVLLLDSRDFQDEFPGTLRKLNLREAGAVLGIEDGDADGKLSEYGLLRLRAAAEELYNRWRTPVFLTLGKEGCIVCDEYGPVRVPGLHLLEKTDPVGAGDSMLAGIAAGLGAGFPPVEAAQLGNLTAGVTVTKLFQTGTASPEEIRTLASNPDFRYNPEKISPLYKPKYYREGEIELVNEIPVPGRFRYAIFDHDGTISTLRQGWEEVMEPVMIEAILGEETESAGKAEFEEVRKSVKEFIDQTTGVQTLVQMQGLVHLVEQFGYVPREHILDENGYKGVYNRKLLEMVEARADKFRRGELDLPDVTIKNSVAFLRALSDRGTVLFLASGTDEEDVKREAELLGYADLFTGGIYGAVGDVSVEPKKEVIKKILAETGADAEIITFGDGPVELRETKKQSGITVGVASNELQRFGLNRAKRERLVLAGADIIVPDFSQMELLISLLFSREGEDYNRGNKR